MAEQCEEITSLRWINSAARQEVDSLRMRAAQLEAYVAKCPPSIRQSPVSIIDVGEASCLDQPGHETPVQVPQVKRSRFAAFFAQMAAASATKATSQEASQGKEAEAAPVVKKQGSTRWTAHYNDVVSALRNGNTTCGAAQGKETETAPVQKESFSPRFTNLPGQVAPASSTDTSSSAGSYEEDEDVEMYGGLLTPLSYSGILAWRAGIPAPMNPVQQEQRPSRFRAFFEQMALVSAARASTDGDSHGKEMQACGELHAPRPVHPKAHLLDNMDL